MIREFSLENLSELDDGRVLVAWKQAVERVVRDCEDRPAVAKARKVILELTLTPRLDQDAQMRDVEGVFQIKDTSPVRTSTKYSLDVRRIAGNQRQLVFNDMSEDNVNQRTIDEVNPNPEGDE